MKIDRSKSNIRQHASPGGYIQRHGWDITDRSNRFLEAGGTCEEKGILDEAIQEKRFAMEDDGRR